MSWSNMITWKSALSMMTTREVLVIIDHLSKFDEAVPCSHEKYDAITTFRLLLQKWFARHGTPTRMQPDNSLNLRSEVSNEFMKAAQITKVTSTAGHLRTQGLVDASESHTALYCCECCVPPECATGIDT